MPDLARVGNLASNFPRISLKTIEALVQSLLHGDHVRPDWLYGVMFHIVQRLAPTVNPNFFSRPLCNRV